MTTYIVSVFTTDNITKHSTHSRRKHAKIAIRTFDLDGSDYIGIGVTESVDKYTYPDTKYHIIKIEHDLCYKDLTVEEFYDSMGINFCGIVSVGDGTPVMQDYIMMKAGYTQVSDNTWSQ